MSPISHTNAKPHPTMLQTHTEEDSVMSLAEEQVLQSTQLTPKSVKKAPQSLAVSSHVTLSESAVDSEMSADAKQRADISQTTKTTAKTSVNFDAEHFIRLSFRTILHLPYSLGGRNAFSCILFP